MNTKTTLSISEARKNIFDIVEAVQKPGVHYTFTANGRPSAVLMSADEFESLIETIEVMRDFPDLDKDIEEADRAYASGAYKKWATLDDILKKEGYVVADKSKHNYGIHSSTRAKRRKSTRKN